MVLEPGMSDSDRYCHSSFHERTQLPKHLLQGNLSVTPLRKRANSGEFHTDAPWLILPKAADGGITRRHPETNPPASKPITLAALAHSDLEHTAEIGTGRVIVEEVSSLAEWRNAKISVSVSVITRLSKYESLSLEEWGSTFTKSMYRTPRDSANLM
jgi:hypothetical protein